MKLKHLKWEPTGRTFEQQTDEGLPTGNKVWEGNVGQRCLYHDNQWKPYVFDPALNRLLFRDQEALEFSTTQESILKNGKQIVKSSKFFVHEMVEGEWQNRPHGQPTKNLQHDFPREGCCTAYLSFPNALYDLQIGFEVGLRRFSKFGFRFRAPISGQVRFQWVLDGIEKLPQNYEWIEEGRGSIENPDPEKRKVGIRFRDVQWRWTYDEALQRSLAVKTNIDDTKKLIITFGPYDYEKDIWLTVSPDTWALTENIDDCFEYNRASYYDEYHSKLWTGVGAIGSKYESGHIWSNVTATGTAQDGCYIKIYDASKTNTPEADVKICNSRDVTAWGAGYRPYTHTAKHTANVDWDNICDADPDVSPEIKTLIQARFDGADGGNAHQSGDEMGIIFLLNAGLANNQLCGYRSEESGVGAKLRIVYTAVGGVAPTAVFYGPLLGPLGGPV